MTRTEKVNRIRAHTDKVRSNLIRQCAKDNGATHTDGHDFYRKGDKFWSVWRKPDGWHVMSGNPYRVGELEEL